MTNNDQPKHQRPSWDHYFMEITKLVATRSTCIRRQVGAIIVKDKKILTTGYNGSPSGYDHCLDVGCLRIQLNVPSGTRHELCRAIHAEQNAIVQAATSGISIQGGTLYCTTHPCSLCIKMIANAGIKRIYYIEGYPDDLSKQLAEEGNLELIQFDMQQ